MDFMKTLKIAAEIQQSKEKERVKKKPANSHNNNDIRRNGSKRKEPLASSDSDKKLRSPAPTSSSSQGVKDSAVRMFLQRTKEDRRKMQAEKEKQKKILLEKRAELYTKTGQKRKTSNSAPPNNAKSSKVENSHSASKQNQQKTHANKPPGGAIEKLKIREKHEKAAAKSEGPGRDDDSRQRRMELKRRKERCERNEIENNRRIKEQKRHAMEKQKKTEVTMSSYERLLKLAEANKDISINNKHNDLPPKLPDKSLRTKADEHKKKISPQHENNHKRKEPCRKSLNSGEKSKQKVPYPSNNKVKPSAHKSKPKPHVESQSKTRNVGPHSGPVRSEQKPRNKSQQNHHPVPTSRSSVNGRSGGSASNSKPQISQQKPQISQQKPQTLQQKPKTFSIVSETTYEKDFSGSGRQANHRALPPGLVRCDPSYADDSEEEYDSEMDDFIDDDENMPTGSNKFDISKHIKDIFGYDRGKFAHFDDRDIKMDASFKDIMKEEVKSARLAKQEDRDELIKEMAHKKAKEKAKEKEKKR